MALWHVQVTDCVVRTGWVSYSYRTLGPGANMQAYIYYYGLSFAQVLGVSIFTAVWPCSNVIHVFVQLIYLYPLPLQIEIKICMNFHHLTLICACMFPVLVILFVCTDTLTFWFQTLTLSSHYHYGGQGSTVPSKFHHIFSFNRMLSQLTYYFNINYRASGGWLKKLL